MGKRTILSPADQLEELVHRFRLAIGIACPSFGEWLVRRAKRRLIPQPCHIAGQSGGIGRDAAAPGFAARQARDHRD